MAYEVQLTADKVVLVFNTDTSTTVPVVRQEAYPDGSTWTKKQAQAWADAYAKFLEDPKNPMPGNSAQQPVFEYVEPVPVVLSAGDDEVASA
jgi:hypothetical protein